MARAVRKAATLAACVEHLRAFVPAAHPLFVVAALGFFAALYLGGLRGFLAKLLSISGPAKTADGNVRAAVLATEVAATDYALCRRGPETDCDWAFTA